MRPALLLQAYCVETKTPVLVTTLYWTALAASQSKEADTRCADGGVGHALGHAGASPYRPAAQTGLIELLSSIEAASCSVSIRRTNTPKL